MRYFQYGTSVYMWDMVCFGNIQNKSLRAFLGTSIKK